MESLYNNLDSVFVFLQIG